MDDEIKLPEHWIPIDLAGASIYFKWAAQKYAEDYATQAVEAYKAGLIAKWENYHANEAEGEAFAVGYFTRVEEEDSYKEQQQGEAVPCVSVDVLSKMAEGPEGLDKGQPGYHWRRGGNAALRRAADYATHPEPAQQPLTDEQERALCEAYCNTASDEYFKARPQLESDVNRRIFYAGHRKAWVEWEAAHNIGAKQ